MEPFVGNFGKIFGCNMINPCIVYICDYHVSVCMFDQFNFFLAIFAGIQVFSLKEWFVYLSRRALRLLGPWQRWFRAGHFRVQQKNVFTEAWLRRCNNCFGQAQYIKILCSKYPELYMSNRLKGSPLRHVFGWSRVLLFEFNPTKRSGKP